MIAEKHDFNLKKYVSLATMALASSGALKAEVHVTEIDPDVSLEILPTHLIGDTLSHELDINNDGIIDVKISAIVDFYQYKPHREKQETYFIRATPLNGAEVLKGLFDARKFNYGESIPGTDDGTWISQSADMAEHNHEGKASGEWKGAADGYLAVKLNIDGNTHYGWVRMDVSDDALSCQVKEYAYNDVPSEGLLTSGTVGVIDHYNNTDIQVYQLENALVINTDVNKLHNATVHIYTLEGRLLLSDTISDTGTQRINLPLNTHACLLAVVNNNQVIHSEKLILK